MKKKMSAHQNRTIRSRVGDIRFPEIHKMNKTALKHLRNGSVPRSAFAEKDQKQ